MSELKYDVAKFVDEEFESSVNVSPKKKQYGYLLMKCQHYSKETDQ